MAENGTLVEVRNLHKEYRRGSERIDVLQGVTLDMPQGDYLALMGPSGSGKTTLLNLLGGLDTPSEGSVIVGGDRIDRMSGGKLAHWRARHIGFVFQLYNLLPVLTAERNVELPLLLTPLSRAERRKHVATALEVVSLSDRAKHYPRQLSGGQEQRVGIARAIVTDPTLLLCDEPTGDLDRKSGDEILDLLDALNREHGKTIVMVTHDAHAAARARRTLHLNKGPSRRSRSREVPAARLEEPLPAEDAHVLHRRVHRRCVHPLRVPHGSAAILQHGCQRGGCGPAAGKPQGVADSAAARELPGTDHRGRRRRGPQLLAVVRRHLPGSRNFFPQFAVDPESYLRLYPEIVLTETERETWIRNRTGAIVGRDLADRFGWAVGDRIPLQGTIFRTADDAPWEFTIDGIFEAGNGGFQTSMLYFHYEYLAEGNARGDRLIGQYVIRVDDPANADAIAAAVDARFANSPAETKTSTESAFAQAMANQAGDIGAIVAAVLAAVFFTILVIAANTMAQAIRERTSELAVLKTLGFTDRKVLMLVLLESFALAAAGGGLGLGLGYLFTRAGDPTGGFLQGFVVPPGDWLVGIALVATLGLLTGILPGVQATRLRIVNALRKV